MKVRLTFLLLFVLGFMINLQAEEKITYRYIDSLTYRLYVEQKWDSLTLVGKLALKNNIDYYYLRMRMGIADYHKGKYNSAITDFSKALTFDKYSTTAKTHIYFSQLYAGKNTMANRYSRVFTDQQKEKMGINISVVNDLVFFGGYSFTDNYEKNGDIDLLEEGSTFGSQLLMGNMAIVSLGINLNFSPTVSLRGAFNYEHVQKRNRYQYIHETWDKEKIMTGQNGSYRNDFFLVEEVSEKSFDSYISQFELYLNAKMQMDDGWSFNLFTNILFLKLTQYDVLLTSNTRQDTLRYNGMTGNYSYVDLEEFDYQFISTDTSFVNYVVGINLQKDFNFIVLDVTASVSKLYDKNQFQAGLSLTYFPFGSQVFYGRTGAIYFSQVSLDNTAEDRVIFNQMLGVKLSKKTWLEGEFYSGDLNNVNIKQAAIVYNLPDEINYTVGLNLHIFVNQHLSLHLLYDYYNKSGAYYNNGELQSEYIKYTTDYQTHNILGGLKWTF